MRLLHFRLSLFALLVSCLVAAAPTSNLATRPTTHTTAQAITHPTESGVTLYLRETWREVANKWHFGMALRMPGKQNDIIHEYVIDGSEMTLAQRTERARLSYPVEGPIYFTATASTAEEVKNEVEKIIKRIPPAPIPQTGKFENCLDCAKHGFEELEAAGYISQDTLQKFNVFYAANEAKVHALTDEHTRKKAKP